MASSYNNTGIVVASVSGAVFIVLCVGFVLLKGRLPFTFSRKISSSGRDIEADLASTYGEYEKYGELYIAPGKQPTVAALDITTRILTVTCLPQKASVSDSSSSSSAAVESKEKVGPPRLFLTRPDRDSLNTLDSKGVPVVASVEAQVVQHAIGHGRQIIEDMADAKRFFRLVLARSHD
jgi:hypothetical protein